MGFWSSLGNFAKGALPIAGSFLGGPLGGALGGAIGGALGGGGADGALKGAGIGGIGGFAFDQMKNANDEANKDRERARGLADQGVASIEHGQNIMNQQWGLGAPMRDAFRFGAFNMGDPTNPFSRGNSMFAPFAAALQTEAQMPPGGASPGGGSPPQGQPSRAKGSPKRGGGASGNEGGETRRDDDISGRLIPADDRLSPRRETNRYGRLH